MSHTWLAGMLLCCHASASYFLLAPPYGRHDYIMYKIIYILRRDTWRPHCVGPQHQHQSPGQYLLLVPPYKEIWSYKCIKIIYILMITTWRPHCVGPQCHHQLAARPVSPLTFSSPHKQRLFLVAFLKQTFSCKQKSKWLYLCTRLFIYFRIYLKASLCFPMGLSTISSWTCWEALFALELLTLS